MTLQNAFGDLALDETVAALTEAVEALAKVVQSQNQLFPPRALQYARTVTDAMRVNIDNQPAVSVNSIQTWNAGAYSGWYGNGGPTSMDPREAQREASQQTFNSVRTNRWVIS